MALLSLALLCLALVSVFTLTSYVPDGPTVLGPIVLALLSLFTLTSYVPDGPTDPGSTVPGPTVPIHPN